MALQEKIAHAFQLFEEGKLKESILVYEELLGNEWSLDDEMNIRYGYGYPLSASGLVDEAIANYTKLKSLGEKEEKLEVVSQALHQMGMVYRQAKQYQEALEHFIMERQMILSHFPENKLFHAANNYELGHTHLLLGNMEEAVAFLEKSLLEAKESGDPIMLACAYRGLGEYQTARQKKEKAFDYYEKSIQQFKTASDERGIAEVRKLMDKIE